MKPIQFPALQFISPRPILLLVQSISIYKIVYAFVFPMYAISSTLFN
jgi:hypothetical protein